MSSASNGHSIYPTTLQLQDPKTSDRRFRGNDKFSAILAQMAVRRVSNTIVTNDMLYLSKDIYLNRIMDSFYSLL